ncbi:MAG: hypothetical protein ACUVSY_18155 [Roseiflexus sp.]
MSGLLQRIADIVYREYDRRIKRASLITEYGMSHHHDHEDAHHDHEVAIVNLPLGSLVGELHSKAEAVSEQHDVSVERLDIEPLTPEQAASDTPVAASAEPIEAEIVNAPPGAPIPRE